MINLSIISTVRGNAAKFREMMNNIREKTKYPKQTEVLVCVDDDDQGMLPDLKDLRREYGDMGLWFYMVHKSDHFSRDYWNYLASKADGRFIIPFCLDNRILTDSWDDIICTRMSQAAARLGDDFVHGLTRDNIKRHGENIDYPHFSCNPVLSREHVRATGYFFDERYWSWGADQAVTILYRKLNEIMREQRLVSLVDVRIFAYNSMHTTDEIDPAKLEVMRQADEGYQRHLRISQEHPCALTPEDYRREACKLQSYIKMKRGEQCQR